MYIYLMTLNILLSRSEACRVFGHCAMGYGTLASSVMLSIHSIRHHDYSIYSSIPEFCSPSHFMFLNFALFHVSILLRIFTPLFYFHSPNPWPWYMPDSHYPDMIPFNTYMFQTSCMFLSLKLTLIVPQTPCLNLWTLVCLSPKILRTVDVWWCST